jgi:hypothetical protein
MPYDASKTPDPEDWLEQERIDQVIEYHRRHHLPMGESVKLHGVAHVVENQIAFGDSPAVPETVARLMGEGLDRHEAIHAVGSVVMSIVFDAVHHKKGEDVGDINVKYADELAKLTAKSWLAQR